VLLLLMMLMMMMMMMTGFLLLVFWWSLHGCAVADFLCRGVNGIRIAHLL